MSVSCAAEGLSAEDKDVGDVRMVGSWNPKPERSSAMMVTSFTQP